MLSTVSQLPGLVDFIEFDERTSGVGHDYFVSNPAVSADFVLLLRDRRKAGDPARPLVEVASPFWRIVGNRTASK